VRCGSRILKEQVRRLDRSKREEEEVKTKPLTARFGQAHVGSACSAEKERKSMAMMTKKGG
jgi:hypothetical protein